MVEKNEPQEVFQTDESLGIGDIVIELNDYAQEESKGVGTVKQMEKQQN